MAKQAHKDRLTAIDASFLHQEKQASHMHVGALVIFDGPPPGREEFAEQTESRLSLVPRYRQKLAFPRLEMGRPFWVDDPSFNLDYHVRHTALPKPGSDEQLRQLVGRIFSQRLDRSKPLWEVWLVQGLDGRPVRADLEDPPRAGGRRRRRGHRHGAVRCPADAAGAARGPRLDPLAGAVRRGARGGGREGLVRTPFDLAGRALALRGGRVGRSSRRARRQRVSVKSCGRG